MASFTDEIMALAGVYADSLLRAARLKNQQDDIAAEFMELIAYLDQHPDFSRFMTSATVDDDARRETLEKLFRGKMSDLLLNTLQVLNRRHRSDLVQAVARAVELRMEEERHQQEIIIETATPLPDDLKSRIKGVLSGRIGKEALLIERVRPEIIGGMIVHVGDQRLDASVLTTIGLVRRQLSNRGSQEIHKGNARYVVEN